jgi:tetratricopeptide (TPR) repeat protein
MASRRAVGRLGRISPIAALLLSSCLFPVWQSPNTPLPPPPPRADPWVESTEEGAVALQQGRLDAAEERLMEARAAAMRGESEDLTLATSLANLAVVQRAQGDDAAAQALYERALAIREKELGAEHPEVLQTMNNLAAVYGAQENYAAAEPLFVRVLAAREKTLGPDDRLTAQSMNNLALLYAAEGRTADAEPLYQRALAALEKSAGANHLDVAKVLENYSALLAETGRKDEAKRLHERAEAIMRMNEWQQPNASDER